jgi:hypothetical protein
MSTPGSHTHRKENKHRAASSSGARTHKRRSSAADEPELERKPPKAERKPLLAAASPTKPARRAARAEDGRDAYQGTLAVAEYERLKKENEALKKVRGLYTVSAPGRCSRACNTATERGEDRRVQASQGARSSLAHRVASASLTVVSAHREPEEGQPPPSRRGPPAQGKIAGG